ncbi:hypothetical protein E4U52_008129 [Claviceps spartinae]|nr:hypothetical protein E4U52_008129 [Claviceps spartinae]
MAPWAIPHDPRRSPLHGAFFQTRSQSSLLGRKPSLKISDFPDKDLRSLWGQTKKTQPTSLTKTPPGSLQADEDVDTEETLPEESQSIIPIRMCTLHCVLAFEEDQPMTVNGSEDQNSCYEVPAVKDPTADDPEDSCSLFHVRCNH